MLCPGYSKVERKGGPPGSAVQADHSVAIFVRCCPAALLMPRGRASACWRSPACSWRAWRRAACACAAQIQMRPAQQAQQLNAKRDGRCSSASWHYGREGGRTAAAPLPRPGGRPYCLCPCIRAGHHPTPQPTPPSEWPPHPPGHHRRSPAHAPPPLLTSAPPPPFSPPPPPAPPACASPRAGPPWPRPPRRAQRAPPPPVAAGSAPTSRPPEGGRKEEKKTRGRRHVNGTAGSGT